MNACKFSGCIGTLTVMLILAGCRTAPALLQTAGHSAPPPELVDEKYLFEIIRYLYRWHLDEKEVEGIIPSKQVVFWVSRLEPKLDPGDNSIFGEILLPQLALSVKVKKADYKIEESKTSVQSGTFRIIQVRRGPLPDRAPAHCSVVQVDTKEMRDYLFRTRNQHDFADSVLIERLRVTLREQAVREGITNAPNGEQVIHLAPLSPVA